MLQGIFLSLTAARLRSFFSCACGLCATLLLLEEAWSSSFPAQEYGYVVQELKPHAKHIVAASNSSYGRKMGQRAATKEQAIQAISGSRNPGIIEHLLIRPGPNASKDMSMLCYPSIGRMDVDTDIRNWVTEIADTFEQHYDANFLNFSVDNNSLGDNNVELHAVYKISQPSSKALSITFELWNKIDGDHSNIDILTLNYSLINGQRLSLSDIFAKPDLALQLMSNWSRRSLNNRYGLSRKQMIDNGTEPLLENFSSLTLTPKGVCINFQPYQVASGELGIQTVEMPLEELASAQPLKIFWGY